MRQLTDPNPREFVSPRKVVARPDCLADIHEVIARRSHRPERPRTGPALRRRLLQLARGRTTTSSSPPQVADSRRSDYRFRLPRKGPQGRHSQTGRGTPPPRHAPSRPPLRRGHRQSLIPRTTSVPHRHVLAAHPIGTSPPGTSGRGGRSGRSLVIVPGAFVPETAREMPCGVRRLPDRSHRGNPRRLRGLRPLPRSVVSIRTANHERTFTSHASVHRSACHGLHPNHRHRTR